MISESVVVLGIPIDNLSMDETVDRIFSMVDLFSQDRRPRQVATVNVDFVVNTLTWRLGRTRHPELLDILQRADLVTPDGMPLVAISRLLGCPLKERVSGSDLVPRLAQEAARKGKSLYFLGGRADVARRAAGLLRERYPGLRIAGVDSPLVHIQGENMADADETDREVVSRINDARPDILLIAFGNPKQEIWFNRNRSRLKVPVSMGVGGTFEFIAGSVRRAPTWVQRAGLEWVFRMTQDPGRLWKRYVIGFFKFGLLLWPAVLYYRYQRLRHGPSSPAEARPGPPPATGPLNVVTLPGRLDAPSLEEVAQAIERAFSRAPDLILDFSRVYFIDSMGLGFLVRTLRRAETNGCELHWVGLTSKTVRFFELNRTWDLFRNKVRDRIEEVIRQLGAQRRLSSFSYLLTPLPQLAVLDLFGRLDVQQRAALDMLELTNAISGKNCILNLAQLDFVDSAGLIFFFKIQKHLRDAGKRCVLCAPNDNVNRLFRLTQLDHLFQIAPDLAAARRLIERPA